VVRVGVLEKLADDGGFVEGFAVVLERGYEAARVELQEGVRFVVRVYCAVTRKGATLAKRSLGAGVD